jgi:SAM-dependent methyltransferase
MLKQYNSQLFNPNLLSVLINPFYFSRKGLYVIFKKICIDLNGVVLDFGCGKKPYKHLFQKASNYIGVDFENEGHPHDNEEIDFFYDGKKLPFDNNKFDIVLASEVFEHIENLDEIILELVRVLKLNGHILVSIPFVYMEHEMPFDFRRFTLIGLEKFLVKNGFKVIRSYKTTSDIQTVFQMIAINIYSFYSKSNKFLKLVLNIMLIFPFTLLGILLTLVFPNNKRFYCNAVVLAQKII